MRIVSKGANRVQSIPEGFTADLFGYSDFEIEAQQRAENARKAQRSRELARVRGKGCRKAATDAMRELVELARRSGSSGPERYYMIISKMTCQALGLEPGNRDAYTVSQLNRLREAEALIDAEIMAGLQAGAGYKEIYKRVKEKVQAFSKSNLID